MKRYILFILSALLLFSCKKGELDFTYSPNTPRAGQTMKITNLSDGEEWLWTYSDGVTSTVKNPNKVFKDVGEYTITLQVDGKKWKTISKTVTVIDTVPVIKTCADTVQKYETVTLSADFYNPYELTVTYDWHLPAEVIITEGDNASAKVSFYLEETKTVTAGLTLTIGEETTELTTTIHIRDAQSEAILYAQGNALYRLPVYDNHYESPVQLTQLAYTQPSTLLIDGNHLYIFDPTVAIYHLNLSNQTQETVISATAPEYGFYAGLLKDNALYWTDKTSAVYSTPAQVFNKTADGTNCKLFSATDFDGLTCTIAGGLGIFADRYFWATGTGITIISADKTYQTILTDYAVTQLQIDEMARKIYCLTADNQLVVANIDGSCPRELAADVACFTLDLSTNRIYLATAHTLAYAALVQAPNNQTAFTQTTINDNLNGITALTIDHASR